MCFCSPTLIPSNLSYCVLFALVIVVLVSVPVVIDLM